MNITIDDIDVDRLRSDLIDYFGSAMFIIPGMAIMEVTRVENASDYEVVQIALENKFDLNDYIKRYTR